MRFSGRVLRGVVLPVHEQEKPDDSAAMITNPNTIPLLVVFFIELVHPQSNICFKLNSITILTAVQRSMQVNNISKVTRHKLVSDDDVFKLNLHDRSRSS